MKCLAQIALDSISGHRIADFFPHGKSDSKMTLHRFSLVVYDKLPISERFPFSKYFLKFFIIFMRNPFFIIITFTSLSKNKQWISTKEAPLLPILGISTKVSFHSYSSITTHQSEKRPLTYSAAYADITFLPFLRRRANT